MSWRDDKHNVTLFFALAIIMITFKHGLATDVISRSTQALQTSNLNTIRSNGDSTSAKMLHIRQLLKSLFLEWNFGESEIKGSEVRTFGRMRMLKKIMLPLAFIGGFMTAIILGIKLTGAINMLLISKVLLLQFALILGKIIYGAKELLGKISYMPQPYYIPVSHEGYSHSSSYAHSRDDSLNQLPNYNYGQPFPQAFNSPTSFQQHPQYNQPINYPLNPTQNFQPQTNFGQPQSGPFSGVSLQAPQQVQTTQNHPQFNQPYYQDRVHNLESLESRLNAENYLGNDAPSALGLIGKPPNPLSPQQMSQLLSDAIAQMSSRTTENLISRRSPNIYRS